MKSTIKLYTSTAFSVLIFASCQAQQKLSKQNKIVLKNTSTIELFQKAVTVKRNQLTINSFKRDNNKILIFDSYFEVLPVNRQSIGEKFHTFSVVK